MDKELFAKVKDIYELSANAESVELPAETVHKMADLLLDREVTDFGYAIRELKAGNKLARKGWNGKGMWIAEQIPDANSKMTLPYFYMKTACDNLVPWLASQTDMFADDWEVVA